MRILVLSEACPVPLDNGMHVRVHNLLLSFKRDFEVTFVCPRPEGAEERASIESLCDRVLYIERPDAAAVGRRQSLGKLLQYGYASPPVLALIEAFRHALDGVSLDAFDLVWIERLVIAPALREVRDRTIVDLDDLTHKRFLREAFAGSGPMARPRLLERGVRWFFRETLETRGFLAAVVCSDEDRAYLERLGLRNVRVVPNEVTMPDLPANAQKRPGNVPRLVFLGNMRAPPNQDAVGFYAREIAPLLETRFPALRLDVIGPGATEEMRAAYEGRVRYRGFAEDLGAALSEYDVLIAPLRFGSGTKLKILDAMAHRMPIVTTPVGAEGLRLRHRESAMIGRSAAELAGHLRNSSSHRSWPRRRQQPLTRSRRDASAGKASGRTRPIG